MPKPAATAGVVLLLAAAALAWTAFGGGDDGSRPARAQEAGAADTIDPAAAAIRRHQRASEGKPQPLPFSHRFHVDEIQIECEYCHTGSRRQAVATMPSTEVCMGCHQYVGSGLAPIDSLRGYASRDQPIPWRRVYKLPEFVQFTHQAHLRNGLECQECHGPVQEMDRIRKAQRLTMGWCLECHRQEPHADDVATTARLAEEAHLPETPDGRQPVGLYPRAISTGYASQRAPDDCAACHY